MKINKIVFFLTIIGLVLIDQLTKIFIYGISKDFGFFALTPVQNTGISFGLLQGSNFIIIFVSLIALGALYYFRKEFETKEIFLALIISGIIGNLIDRVFIGSVRDFLDLKWWPVFNGADSMLFIGVIGLLITIIIQEIKINSKRTKKQKQEKQKSVNKKK